MSGTEGKVGGTRGGKARYQDERNWCPALPDNLSREERHACLNLAYTAMRLSCGSIRLQGLAQQGYREALRLAARSDAMRDYYNSELDGEQKHDRHGNVAGEAGDLGKVGAFQGFKILIGQFYPFDNGKAIEALERKGFEVRQTQDEHEFLADLDWCDVACFISGSGCPEASSANFLEACTAAREAGKGFWIFADNDPFYAHANILLKPWFGWKFEGDTPGGKVLSLAPEECRVQMGQFQQHTLTNGITKLFEGITICHPPKSKQDDFEDLEVIAMSTDGNPSILVGDKTSLDDNRGRVILDSAFTKLYCNWDDAGTARYIVNGFCWLLALEHQTLRTAILGAIPISAQRSVGTRKLARDQMLELQAAVDRVVASSSCAAFPLAVAVWLRDKRELGNRIISTTLLAQCARCEATRPFARRAARLLLKLPTDLQDVVREIEQLAADEAAAGEPFADAAVAPSPVAGRPMCRNTCVKKMTRDFLDGLSPYQAAKYSGAEKMRRARRQLKKAKARLEACSSADSNQARAEVRRRDIEKRIAELEGKLVQQQAGDLRWLIRRSHASANSDLVCRILGKRYPENAEEFAESGLPGEFEPERRGEPMKLVPPKTWDRELSDKGNVPSTWAALLRDKDERSNYTLPYMALLRNMRNVLLMGLPPSFLRSHVLSRLPVARQIRGSGQTSATIAHTWTTLEKEFSEEKLAEMHEQATAGLQDVLTYRKMLKRLCRPIFGYDDKQIGLIGEFLGEPLWQRCGLKKKGDCYLALNRVQLRGGQDPRLESIAKGKGKGKRKGKGGVLAGQAEKWLPVALHPLTPSFLLEVKGAFEKAIEVAASFATEGGLALDGSGDVVLWMDLSNPPLEEAAAEEAASATAVDEAGACTAALGVPPGEAVARTRPGQELELDELSTHQNLCLELRYLSKGPLDYNVLAYSIGGRHLWSATAQSKPVIENKAGTKCVVHCRDIGASPSKTKPALRQVHLDIDALDEQVFALMLTSQSPSETRPTAASLVLRECHSGGATSLAGGHEPIDYGGSKMVLCQDISEPLRLGGTVVYACVFRNPRDRETWLFRNTMELTLTSESRNAAQIQRATGEVFRQLLSQRALSSTMDLNAGSYARLCQLYSAASGTSAGCGRGVRVLLSGIRKRMRKAEVVELTLTGEHLKDLEIVKAAKEAFSSKVADTDESLRLVLAAVAAETTAPALVVRVAGNSLLPAAALRAAREAANCTFPYANIDGRGHLYDVFEELPELERVTFLPAAPESCVTILQNILAQQQQQRQRSKDAGNDAATLEPLVRYIDSFLPHGEETP